MNLTSISSSDTKIGPSMYSENDGGKVIITLMDGSTITIPKNEILTIYSFLSMYLEKFGAFDLDGNEVIWPEE